MSDHTPPVESSHARRRIVLSLGRSAPGDGGLFEYSSQLGLRVARQAAQWRERWNVQVAFAVQPELEGFFGSEVEHLTIARRDRQPLQVQADLWHTLNQLNRQPPAPGCPVRVLTVHDLNHLYAKNAFSRWRAGRRLRKVVANADHIVAISRHTADDVEQHLGWRGALEVIHNGARDLSSAPQEPLPGLDPVRRPFLFHLSRLSRSKNPQALFALAQAWPEMTLLLCGPPSDEVRRLQARNRLPNLDIRTGISEAQKAWAYAHCAGFVFPSITEGFGLPPIEAMHFAKPVFLARRTCLPEIGGDAAWYLDDFDGRAMRTVVEQGLREAAAPGRAAAIKARAMHFDWDRCAQAYLALYQRLLGLPPD